MKTLKTLPQFFLTLSMLCLAVSATQADPVVKKEREVQDFSGIKVGGAFNVILKQGSSHNLIIEAEADLHESIITEVKGEVLHIELEGNWKLKNHQDITIWVDFVNLDYLNISGAANIKAEGPVKTEDIKLSVSGAGDVELELQAESLDAKVSGAGDLDLSGRVVSQKIELSGDGDYRARELSSDYINARATGAGSITVKATREIEAKASGAGSIEYYGKPEIEKTNSSGAGSIKRL